MYASVATAGPNRSGGGFQLLISTSSIASGSPTRQTRFKAALRANDSTTIMVKGKGKGKGKGRGKSKLARPDRAPQSVPYLPKTPRPAPHAVVALTTYEILEAILLRLDEQTLLVSAQRVSTLWRRVVTTSFPLQCRLFFLLSPPPPTPSPGATTAIMRKFNPFLQRAFPCLLPARSYYPGAVLPPFLCAAAAAGSPPFKPAGAPPSDFRPPILDARFGGARHRAGSRARRPCPAAAARPRPSRSWTSRLGKGS